jgi:membrane protein implicated in regulation of membrane protease activity
MRNAARPAGALAAIVFTTTALEALVLAAASVVVAAAVATATGRRCRRSKRKYNVNSEILSQ